MPMQNPMVPPGPASGSQAGQVMSGIGKSLLMLTGIGAPIAGLWDRSDRRDREANINRGRQYATGLLTEAMDAAGTDPMSQRNALINVVRQIQQDPNLVVDNPNLIEEMVGRAKELQAPQPTLEKMGAGQTLMSISPDQQTVTPLAQTPSEPTALEKQMQMYMDTFGMTQQEALKRAGNEYSIAQLTDEYTRVTTPILIDKITGTGQVIGGGPGHGTMIPADTIRLAQESGLLNGEIGVDSAMSGLEQTEQMSAAEATALGTGAASAAGRTVANLLTSFFVDGVQDQTLLDSKASIGDLQAELTTYARDEAGTARLAGITEMNVYKDLGPKLDWGVSREENVTNLIRLRGRLERDMARADEALQEPHSPEFRKQVESLRETQNSMLSRIGTREELAKARDYIKKNPQDTKKIFDILSKALGRAPETVARAKEELSNVGAEATAAAEGGLPPEEFAKVKEKARTAPETITDEELDAMSAKQLQELEELSAQPQ